MTFSTVTRRVMAQVLRTAKIKDNFRSATDLPSAQKGLWWMADAAQNRDFENIVSNAQLAELDDKIHDGKVGTLFATYLNNLDRYFNLYGLNPAGTALASNGLIAFLQAYNLRVPQDFADIYFEAKGGRKMDAVTVFADERDDNILGTLAHGGSAAALAALPLNSDGSVRFGDTPLQVVVTTQIGTGDKTVTVTAKHSISDTAIAIPVVATSAAAISTKYNVGECSPTANPALAATQLTLDTGDGAYFANGQWILITESLDHSGTNVIVNQYVKLHATTGVAGDVLTFASGYSLIHDFSTSAKVLPCFKQVTALAQSGSDAGAVKITPRLDYTPALNDASMSGISN